MAKFFVGQRVKLARPDSGSIERGLRAGDQGVIASKCITRCWRVDFGGRINPFQGNENFPCLPDELEPILDQHTPCESEFKESLDKLLEGIPA